MASHKSMLDKILETKAELERQQGCFGPNTITGTSTSVTYPPNLPPLPKPTLEELLPDQKEMDKLASALTEAVLQLRAGDMEGARATLNDADRLCDVRISAHATQVPDHYLDALRYGMGMSKQYTLQPEGPRTATEQLMKQQAAERAMRMAMENMNSTIYPPHILSDITADPTDSGV